MPWRNRHRVCAYSSTAAVVAFWICGSMFSTSARTVSLTPVDRLMVWLTVTPPPTPPRLWLGTMLPVLPGTNNSGPLSPTRYGRPEVTPPPATGACNLEPHSPRQRQSDLLLDHNPGKIGKDRPRHISERIARTFSASNKSDQSIFKRIDAAQFCVFHRHRHFVDIFSTSSRTGSIDNKISVICESESTARLRCWWNGKQNICFRADCFFGLHSSF